MSQPFISTVREALPLFSDYPDDYVDDKALPHFIHDCLKQLDLSELESLYSIRGRKAYAPRLLLGAWILGYVCGVSSSRRLEEACRFDLRFHIVVEGLRPDHDTLNRFRQRCESVMDSLFAQVLDMAGKSNVTDLSMVCLDGTKMKANASLRRNMDAKRAHHQLSQASTYRDWVDDMAEKYGEDAELRSTMEAKATRLEKQARKVLKKLSQRPTTKKPERAKVNTTDEDSGVMRTAKGHFEQSYNAQAGVDPITKMVMTQDVSTAANDMKEVAPTLEAMEKLPKSLGEPTALVADAGYSSTENLERCEEAGIVPYFAPGRELPEVKDGNGPSLRRKRRNKQRRKKNLSQSEAKRRNAQLLSEPLGRAVYDQRGSSGETVLGIVRNVMGFNSFRLRGLSGVRMEWSLVCMSWNLKRLHGLSTPS